MRSAHTTVIGRKINPITVPPQIGFPSSIKLTPLMMSDPTSNRNRPRSGQKGTRLKERRTRLNSPKTKVLMLIAEMVVGIVTNITNKMSNNLGFKVN